MYIPHRIRALFPSKRNHQSLASYMYSFQNVIYSIQSTKCPCGKYVGKPMNHCAPQHFQADTQWKTETASGRTFLTMQPRSVWLLSLDLQRHSTIHLQKRSFRCQIPNSASFWKLQRNGDADFMSLFFYATIKAISICLHDTEINNLPLLLASLSFSSVQYTLVSLDSKLIITIQPKLQSEFYPSLLAGMFLLWQAQEMPGLCFLSVALTRVVISPVKSLLACFISDGVIVDVGPVPLPTQTKSRQIIGSSSSVSPQNMCITDSSCLSEQLVWSFVSFMGLQGEMPLYPEILTSSGLKCPWKWSRSYPCS